MRRGTHGDRAGKPSWQELGDEPDYRFSLANERTFLAWIRTSLALMAAAVAVAQLVPALNLHGARRLLGVAFAATALIISATSYHRWAGAQRAMRHHAPLPRNSPLLQVVAAVLSVSGLIVVILVLVH